MPRETLVGTPDPEDNRTPEQKHEDHLTDIRRDQAVGNRQWQETLSRIATAGERLLPPEDGKK